MKKLLLFIVVGAILQGMVYSQIEVKSPNGGELLIKDSSHTITWDSGNVPGNVKIQLLKGGVNLGAIHKDTKNDGSFFWKIDKLTNGTVIPTGSDFRIRIISLSNGTIRDRSNANFTIRSHKVSKFTKNYPKLLPDLRATLSVTPFQPNQWIYITITIHNDTYGDIINSGGTTLLQVFYKGTKSNPVYPEQLRKEWKIYNYNIPHKSSVEIKKKTLLFNQQDGIYNIVVKLDATNVVQEVNEKNNWRNKIYIVE